MMGDSGKPFACTEMGCNQRFVNEDHLEVHRRKHEMSLGLRDYKSLDTPVIDQTPTPTRFLKNCEEVGLFNEPPNPFDAMFRKASEHGGPDSIESSSPKIGPDNSLEVSDPVIEITDTPNNAIEEYSQQAVSSTTTEDTQQMEETIVVQGMPGDNLVSVELAIKDSTSVQTAVPVLQRNPVFVNGNLTSRFPNNSFKNQAVSICQSNGPFAAPILLRLPNGQTIPVVPPSVANPSAPVPVAMSAVQQVSVVISKSVNTATLDSNLVRQKLKNTLLTCQSQGNMGVMTQAVDVVTRQQAGVTAQEMMEPLSPNSPVKRKRRNSDMNSDEKRERFLERNRAAATRCRNKRKVWINSLEQKADEMNSTNSVLMSEVTKLREEVAQLKQLLLAHNNCPVTVMQRQAHGNLLAASTSSDSSQSSMSLQHHAENEDVQAHPR